MFAGFSFYGVSEWMLDSLVTKMRAMANKAKNNLELDPSRKPSV